jgi:hypothetical protein
MQQRSCVRCGKLFEAKRITAKYCGSTCRARWSERPVEAAAPVVAAPEVVGLPPAPPSRLVVAVTAELEAASRLSTAKGQMVLLLAEAFANPFNNGSQQAALMRELRACLEAALEGSKIANDPLDEIRARRERIMAAESR